MSQPAPEDITHDILPSLLADDKCVKVAGVDADGILRGKLISKKKFLSVARDGFGFCSIIFGWDMHDMTYTKELLISNAENGYRDLIAVIDLQSFRRIPWENNVPFFLCSFTDPDTGESTSACPRSVLKRTVDKLKAQGMGAMAGAEYEFYHFRAPTDANPGTERNSSSTAAFLRDNAPSKLPALEEGMFGYSLSRPVHNQDYYYEVFDVCSKFRCDIEGWHTETGPGVYEAALQFDEICEMADRAALFKLAVKSIASKHAITPCFMAKPIANMPGNSGHIHISVVDRESGKNLFYRETPDENPPYPDLKHFSDLGRHFIAGVLEALPSIMPLLAPNINSYKRLVENFWAPVTVSWGLEHRAASVRLIAPPTSSTKATRLEIRVPGADTNPYFALAAILAAGWRGVEEKLEISVPPLGKGQEMGSTADKGERLPKSLKEATNAMAAKGSIARNILGDEFVDHYAGTRDHELRLWEEAVTDWEFKRYIETV
ncbi:glutamine synthetase-like protein [Rhizodiscina lignyota]|uniref:Glutamine synthetase n=1 Tax=Rhizodiscina lignyota TaxID=1504668 RepID=A0A9P4IAJ1_9PEZI|nr:glutamine synthetase-like protein [Rhizodiscina lignyota]